MRFRRWRALVALCVVLGAALPPISVQAFQPLITDDTGTQGAGGNQLEGSFARTDATNVTRAAGAVYTRGVTDALDALIGLTHLRRSSADATTEDGWSNSSLGAKWRFFDDEQGKLSFALRPELQLPVSAGKEARGSGTARTSWRLDLLMTQKTGFGTLHANLASSRVNFNDAGNNDAIRRSLYRLSVAPVWNLTGQWKLALDTGIVTNPDRAQKARMGYLELGAIYSPSKDLEFALGAIRNYSSGPANATQLTAGVTWRFM